MKAVLQQIGSLILPVTALILVPLWIERHFAFTHGVLFWTGLFLATGGLIVMAWTITTFIRIGRGTLAPWSPTRKLVISGVYAHVRNPMIMGVLSVLFGEASAFASVNILIWALVFFVINTIYFIYSEEPGLEKRFGAEYLEYKGNVPRWIPRWKPWKPEEP